MRGRVLLVALLGSTPVHPGSAPVPRPDAAPASPSVDLTASSADAQLAPNPFETPAPSPPVAPTARVQRRSARALARLAASPYDLAASPYEWTLAPDPYARTREHPGLAAPLARVSGGLRPRPLAPSPYGALELAPTPY